jgi:membrane-associated phospholipid phosphatase
VSFAVFAVLAVAAPDHQGGLAWDSFVLRVLNALFPISSDEIHPDPFLQAVVVLGTAGAGLLALWLVRLRRWRSALFLVGSIAGTVALSSLTKVLVQRPAIESGGSDSFPSGTAAWAAALTAACVILAPARFRLWVAGAGAVGVLLYSAVITWEEWHYSTDVLGGWALALGWVSLLGSVLLPDRPRQRSYEPASGAAP